MTEERAFRDTALVSQAVPSRNGVRHQSRIPPSPLLVSRRLRCLAGAVAAHSPLLPLALITFFARGDVPAGLRLCSGD